MLYIYIGKAGSDIMEAKAKVSRKWQVVIPKEIRQSLDLRPGDKLQFKATKSGIKIGREKESQFDKQTSLDTFLKETGISMKPFTSEILWKAGEAWNEYRSRGGKRKDRILPDFLIGAFTSMRAEWIVTRDKGFYKKNFSLKVFY